MRGFFLEARGNKARGNRQEATRQQGNKAVANFLLLFYIKKAVVISTAFFMIISEIFIGCFTLASCLSQSSNAFPTNAAASLSNIAD
jgi:hypothetical protein